MRSVFLQSSSSNHSTCHTVISVTITCKRRLVSHTTDSRKPADSLQMSNLSVSRFSNHISLNIAALFIWNFPNPNNTFLRLLGSLGSLGPPYTHVREEGSQQRRRHVFTRLRTADEMLNKLNSPCGDEAVWISASEFSNELCLQWKWKTPERIKQNAWHLGSWVCQMRLRKWCHHNEEQRPQKVSPLSWN